MDITDFIWLYLLISILTPMLQRRRIETQRLRLLRRIEQMRGSRVITMIQRQESFAFLGVPFGRYIDIEDSEAVLRAVRLTPPDMPIDLVLHTPGGVAVAAEQIAEALLRHKLSARAAGGARGRRPRAGRRYRSGNVGSVTVARL